MVRVIDNHCWWHWYWESRTPWLIRCTLTTIMPILGAIPPLESRSLWVTSIGLHMILHRTSNILQLVSPGWSPLNQYIMVFNFPFNLEYIKLSPGHIRWPENFGVETARGGHSWGFERFRTSGKWKSRMRVSLESGSHFWDAPWVLSDLRIAG